MLMKKTGRDIGTLIFGIKALENSETFNLLGIKFAISSADWTPVIISLIVLVVGIILVVFAGKR